MDDVALDDHNGVAWEDKTDIVIDVDGLAIGTYTFRIEVTDHDTSDEPALTATDEAIVTVVAELATTSTPANSSSTESDSNVLFIPIVAMLLAIGIGVPILKHKDFKQ